jgi:hypothetical protein
MFFHVFRMFDLHLTNFRQLTSPLNYRPTACATVFLQIFDWNLMWNNGIAPSIFWGIASRYARKCLIENVKKKRRIGRRNRPGKVCRKRAPQDAFQTKMLENWLQGTSYGTGSQKRQLFPKLCHNHENHIPLFIFYLIRTFDKHDQYKYMQKSSRMSHKIRRGRTGCLLVNHWSAIWREDKACLCVQFRG